MVDSPKAVIQVAISLSGPSYHSSGKGRLDGEWLRDLGLDTGREELRKLFQTLAK